jgi:hypothetical protein
MSKVSPLFSDMSFFSLIPLDLASQDVILGSYYFDAALIDAWTVAKNCTALSASLEPQMGGQGGLSADGPLGNLNDRCVVGVMTREANADAVNKRLFCNGEGQVRLPKVTRVGRLQLVL